jgi:DNA invertase Pin-like site-specific DNA recombinase
MTYYWHMAKRKESLVLDGYIRVSQVRGRQGDSFISPAVQKDRIGSWARAYGHSIAQYHEELDESGGRADRPKLLHAIERVESGELDGLVVAKLDRFARSLIDGLRLIDRIESAGGTFVSVDDGFDLTTDTGRLVLKLMLSLAEFELDRTRSNWNDAKAQAVARGIHISALAPCGYSRPSAGGPLVPDPLTAPLVRELFERRNAGAGPTELADFLNESGAVTRMGRDRWSHRAVKDILRNDVYLGIASAGEHRNDAAHEPLIDRAVFDAVQWRGIQFPPRSAEPSPIRPLLRCASCRYAMRAERRALSSGDVWYFTCRAASHRTAWECPAPAAIKDSGQLEEWIVSQLFAHVSTLEARSEDDPNGNDHEHALERARALYEEWRDNTDLQERLGMEAYIDGLASRQSALNEAIRIFTRTRVADDRRVSTVGSLDDLKRAWPDLSLVDKRELLGSAIQCVFIRGSKRDAPLEGRLHLCWQGEQIDLPARGKRNWQTRPFEFPEAAGS